MQQSTIVHKKIKSNNQKVVSKSEELKNKRERKGYELALSRNVFYLSDSKDVYYVQSQHSSEIYYYVKYNHDVFEWCSCKDHSTRHALKCKHLFAIEFAIKWGIIKDIDKLSAITTTAENVDVKPDTTVQVAPLSSISKSLSSYKDDDYTF